jgi:hypothetical protein
MIEGRRERGKDKLVTEMQEMKICIQGEEGMRRPKNKKNGVNEKNSRFDDMLCNSIRWLQIRDHITLRSAHSVSLSRMDAMYVPDFHLKLGLL